MKFYNHQGRAVGELLYRGSELWLVKRVQTYKHMLRQPAGAWATDAAYFPRLRQQGAAGIVLIVDGGKKVLSARLETFEAKGFRVSRRFGEQVGLMEGEWRRSRTPSPPQPAEGLKTLSVDSVQPEKGSQARENQLIEAHYGQRPLW